MLRDEIEEEDGRRTICAAANYDRTWDLDVLACLLDRFIERSGCHLDLELLLSGMD